MQNDQYAANTLVVNAFSYLLPYIFSHTTFLDDLSCGYLPAIDPAYLGMATLTLYCFNDCVGQQLIDPLLGAIAHKRNDLALKLAISIEDANKLLLHPGQSLRTEILNIQYQGFDRASVLNTTLTVAYICDQLNCNEREALMLLATKGPKTLTGEIVSFIAKTQLPRLSVSFLIGWALDNLILKLLSPALMTAFQGSVKNTDAMINVVLLIICISLKAFANALSREIDQYRLTNFHQTLKLAHNAHFATNNNPMRTVNVSINYSSPPPATNIERNVSSTRRMDNISLDNDLETAATPLLDQSAIMTVIAYRGIR